LWGLTKQACDGPTLSLLDGGIGAWEDAAALLKLGWWLAALNGMAVFVVGAARLNWPSAAFWDTYRIHVLVALGATAAVPVAQASMAQLGERSRSKELEKQRDIETCLTSSLIYCVKHAGAHWLDIGIQAFVVAGRWPRVERQERVAKVRLRPVSSSGVSWGKGKGVIGRCWATHAPQYEDLEVRFAAYSAIDQAGWESLPESTRFGLSYDDFQRLKDKYGIVAAVPIKDASGKYLGCVTADAAPRGEGVQALVKDEILASLGTTADLVAALLKR
jgi:hypothetical protein